MAVIRFEYRYRRQAVVGVTGQWNDAETNWDEPKVNKRSQHTRKERPEKHEETETVTKSTGKKRGERQVQVEKIFREIYRSE